jgi:hypothetical protein
MAKYLTDKDAWIQKICKMAYEGHFDKAQKIIGLGEENELILTKKNATEIIECCGMDLPYSFIKSLVDIGGKIPKNFIDESERYLSMWTKKENAWNNKENERMKNFLDDRIKGYKFIIKKFKKKSKKQ